MRSLVKRSLILLVSVTMLPLAVLAAAAGERRPVPAVTIYPGDIIREQMLTDAEVPNGVSGAGFASNLAMLVGKAARRTLLPGQPIAASAIMEPKLVKIGAMVRLVYEEDGLQIITFASALQAGAAGDVVAVRNLESGLTISGVVRPDGTIRVGPG